jgi:putative flippase GtrA
MIEKAKSLYLTHQELAHYFVLAAFLVSFEYLSFLGMIWAGINYLIAVVVSMGVVIVLNWYLSRLFVFKSRRHSAKKEFLFVLLISLVGVGFQLAVTYTAVALLGQLPALGKLAAIIVTFFWNFWARKRFVF